VDAVVLPVPPGPSRDAPGPRRGDREAACGDGVTNDLELDLAAGDHIAICFVPDFPTGTPHVALGMIAPFTLA
jgi:hypothetical protein